MLNLSNSKGTRDFLPHEVQRRNFIFTVIREVFALFGFQQIETPAIEELSTLTGKYGEEGDKLLFKILNSGDFLKDVDLQDVKCKNLNRLSKTMCGKGLRYDLTVPFARFVVMHRNDIQFPFKRFQIQPVWRSDRPQKGRYREFCQCDVDVIGSKSLLYELEMLQIIEEIFKRLNIEVTTHINNRKILYGLACYIGAGNRMAELTVILDKYEKIGVDGVMSELKNKGFSEDETDKLLPLLQKAATGNANDELIMFLNDKITDDTGREGLKELAELLNYIQILGLETPVIFDLLLARGLDYYTGAIFEVKAGVEGYGSLCGGGRYDNLAEVFGMPGLSGVGVSFGADRIYDVMENLGLFPANLAISSKVLLVNFGSHEEIFSLKLLRDMRKNSIPAEIYPDPGAKIKKQLSYASSKKIMYVVIAGENEMKTGKIILKEMESGKQSELTPEDVINFLKPHNI